MSKPKQKRIHEISHQIIRMSLDRVPNRYTDNYGRWVWVAGFLAGWLARIVISDITVRQQLQDYIRDNQSQ